MAGSNPTQLPAYIQLRYEENGIFDRLSGAAESAADRTKRSFSQAFKETETAVTTAVDRMASKYSKLDLGVGDMRQQKAQLQQYRDALDTVARAAQGLARETGDTSASTRNYLQALRSQRLEAERALKVAESQITTYSRLQTALDKVSGAPGPDMRDAVQRLRDGDAAIHRAALSGATLESVLGRVAQKGRHVSAAMQEAARTSREAAQEAARIALSQPASAAPLNTRFGAEAIVAGNAAMDRAALSGTTLEQVLGRVAVKGQAVTSALNSVSAAAAQAQREKEQLAAAVDRLNAQLDPAAAATQRLKTQMSLLDDALEKGAIDAQRHAQMMELVSNASHEGTTAFRAVTNSQGAMRIAMLQSGQQMQDVAISLYSGQRASVVFAQQLPQLAFALTGLEGSANKTYDRIGRFATFLSGPWGLAVGLGVGVLASFVAQLVMAGDEADQSGSAMDRLADRIDFTKNSYQSLIDVVEQYNEAQSKTESLTYRAIMQADDMARANLKVAESNLERIRTSQEFFEQYGAAIAAASDGDVSGIQAGTSLAFYRAQQRIDQLNSELGKTGAAAGTERVRRQFDERYNIEVGYDEKIATLEERRKKNLIDQIEYEKQRLSLLQQQQKALEAYDEAHRKTSGSGAGALSRDARLGDVVALVKQLFPGARITSTTGGKHAKGSDHYAGRAIDFVPGGGMGQYTTAQVEQILEDAGVDIRRNARGTKQIFGPGRSASRPGDHDDHFHFAFDNAPDPEKIAAAAERAKQKLIDFGERSADAIGRISSRFGEQPRLIRMAALATGDLDSIIAELSERKPPGFEQLIADAEAAKDVIQDALVRPFRELTEDSDRRLQIQELLAQGREDEADALTEVWRMEDMVGDLTADQVKYVRDVVRHEKERTRELERQRDLFEAQLDVLDEARASLTDLLSGRSTNFFKDVGQALRDLQGQRLFDSLFGDLFQQLEDELRGKSPLGRESQRFADEMSVATNALDGFTRALGRAGAANDNGSIAPEGSTTFNEAFGALISGRTVGWHGGLNPSGTMSATGDGGEIVVTAKRPIDLSTKSIFDIADGISGAMVAPLQQALSDAFGTRFGQMISGVLQGFIGGKLVGGTTGGILGGLKGIVDQTGIFGGAEGGVSGALGGMLKGSSTGTLVSGISNSLGLKMSGPGAQIGGAIGSMIPIPGGQIIGLVAGGLLGGLFGKTKWGRVDLSAGGASASRGNSGSSEEAAVAAGGSFYEGLNNIIDQLGGTMGDFGSIALGVRHGDWRVNTGSQSLKVKKGAKDFNEDQAAALEYALKAAIDRGAVKGIRDSSQRLLRAGKDLDKALQDALDWENAFRELKRYKDPLGAAMDDLDREFEKLIDLAKQAGASTEEWADLEELYGIRRDEIIRETSERLTSSLQGLLDDLTIGDNGLSLRTREENALARYQPLAARVAAGDQTAYDDYAEAARELLDIERQLYGSQKEYFDRLNEVTALTRNRIDAETNVVSIAENRDSPFDSAGKVRDSIENQTTEVVSWLKANNDNLGIIAALLRAGSNPNLAALGRTPVQVMNF